MKKIFAGLAALVMSFSMNVNVFSAPKDIVASEVTTTALASSTEIAEIRAYLDNYSKSVSAFDSFETKVDLTGNVKIDVPQLPGGSMAIPISTQMSMQINLAKPFIHADVKANAMGEDISFEMYDDGNASYVKGLDGTSWDKTSSSLPPKEQMEALLAIASSHDSVKVSDSYYSKLRLHKSDGKAIIEGTLFMDDVYNDSDINTIMSSSLNQLKELGFSTDFELPSDIAVKYIFDESTRNFEGCTMHLDFNFSLSDNSSTNINVVSGFDINVYDMKFNSNFNTTVPSSVINSSIGE